MAPDLSRKFINAINMKYSTTISCQNLDFIYSLKIQIIFYNDNNFVIRSPVH